MASQKPAPVQQAKQEHQAQQPNQAQLWTERYHPNSVEEFIGNSDAVETSQKWARAWDAGKRPKPILLHGQTGTGKTSLAYLTAKLNGWDLFEMNASDFRTKDLVEKLAGSAAQGATFSGALRMVLIDEADGLQGVTDRGGAGAISGVIRSAQNPVMLTADDAYSQKLRALRSLCTMVEFKKINYLSIAKRLREILDLERAKYDEDAVKELAKNCAGDFRSALLDLQTLAGAGEVTMDAVSTLGHRDRSEKIFKVLREIFAGKDLAEIRKARASSELSNDLLERWIEENIPRQYTKPEDTAAAFERLSRADIFNGRIMRRQHFGFMRYSGDLMSAGVALSRKHDYHDFVMYRFPGLLSKLSRSKPRRALRGALAKKIGGAMHSSAHRVITADLPYLQVLMENKELAPAIAARFDLNEEEIAFMLGTKPETKKVQKLFENAQHLRAEQLRERRKQFAALHSGAVGESVGGQAKETGEEAEKQATAPGEEAKQKPEEGQTSLGGYLRN